MNFNSSDFGSEVSLPPAAAQAVRPRRSRAVLGTLLAAVIAFILIAIVLAIISVLGERRLSLLPRGSSAPVAVHQPSRATPGLSAPSPLPILRPPGPSFIPADGPEPAHGLAAAPPAGVIPTARMSAQAPPEADVVPPPALVPPPQPTEWQFRKVLGSLPFTRIHDALLWKPYTEPNRKALLPPEPDENLGQLRQASRLTPEAVQTIVEQRRPMATLAAMRAEAAMHRTLAATTQPSS